MSVDSIYRTPYQHALDQAMIAWKRFGVVYKGDIVGSCADRSTLGNLLYTHKMAYIDSTGILRASISRKQLQLLIDMENL